MRTFLTTASFLALMTATAAAEHRSYSERSAPAYSSYSLRDAPQNRQPQTEPRYQELNKLADVGLAGYGNRAFVRIPQTGPLDYLELRAGHVPVALRDVVVQFADGTFIHTGSRGVVEPYEGRVIDLPRGHAPVIAVMPEYDTPARGAARLEVFGVPEQRHSWGYRY